MEPSVNQPSPELSEIRLERETIQISGGRNLYSYQLEGDPKLVRSDVEAGNLDKDRQREQ